MPRPLLAGTPGDDAYGCGVPRERPTSFAARDRLTSERLQPLSLRRVRRDEELLMEPTERAFRIAVCHRVARAEPEIEETAARQVQQQELRERGQRDPGLAMDRRLERLGGVGRRRGDQDRHAETSSRGLDRIEKWADLLDVVPDVGDE